MREIEPPHDNFHWKLSKAYITLCPTYNKVTCALLWDTTEGTVFEKVHGCVSNEITDITEIVKLARSRCIGTLVSDPDGRMYDHEINRPRGGVRVLFKKAAQ